MKELSELGLKPEDLKKVTDWLKSWVTHFTNLADGAKGTVERYDLEKLDFFYFTDCRDILSEKSESAGVEQNKNIRKKKRAVEYGLIFRKLLGETIGRKRPCSHCGNPDRFINSLSDGTGHYVFCPKCGMTTIVTYPNGYDTCTKRVCEDLVEHGYAVKKEAPKNTTAPVTSSENTRNPPEKEITFRKCDTCGNQVEIRNNFSFSTNQCNDCYFKLAKGTEIRMGR